MKENIPPVRRSEYTEGAIKEKIKALRKHITNSIRELMLIRLPVLGGNARRDAWTNILQRHIALLGYPDKDVGQLSIAARTPENVTVQAILIDTVADVVELYWDYREKAADPEIPASWLAIETQIRKHLAVWKAFIEHCDDLTVVGSMKDGWVISVKGVDPFGLEVTDEKTTEIILEGEGSSISGPPTLGHDIGVGNRRGHIIVAGRAGDPASDGGGAAEQTRSGDILPPGLEGGSLPNDHADD